MKNLTLPVAASLTAAICASLAVGVAQDKAAPVKALAPTEAQLKLRPAPQADPAITAVGKPVEVRELMQLVERLSGRKILVAEDIRGVVAVEDMRGVVALDGRERPLSEFLDRVCSRLGLSWGALDKSTIAVIRARPTRPQMFIQQVPRATPPSQFRFGQPQPEAAPPASTPFEFNGGRYYVVPLRSIRNAKPPKSITLPPATPSQR